MRALFLFGMLLAAGLMEARAQDGFVSQSGSTLGYNVFDRNGKIFVNPAPDVAGSPFYKDDWRVGALILMDNRRFDTVRARLNLQSGEVHVMITGNEVALPKTYIKEILWPARFSGIPDAVRFQNGFPAVDAQDALSYYEVLCQGKMWLLHSIRKVIAQQKDELSGEVRKEYKTYEDYYAFDGKTMQRIKKDKAFIENLLADKKDKVEAFLTENKLKLKSMDEIQRVIEFYNTQ
jgi:hypothetical protein